MGINVRRSSILEMVNLCKKHKHGELKRSELDEMLNHEDYKIELERYATEGLPICNISKDEFMDYFMNIFDIELDDIQNDRLKSHHDKYIRFFENIDVFEKNIDKLLSTDDESFKSGLQFTYSGLPDNIKYDNFDIIFTISIGNSFGWPLPQRNCIHFDVLQFFDMCDLGNKIVFEAFMSHEVHHMGMFEFGMSIDRSNFDLEDELYFFLAFEGLAVKYCNNGEGHLTKKMYSHLETNIGLDEFTFDYFNEKFEEIYIDFKYHINSIRNGTINDFNVLKEYWFNLHTEDQDKSEVPKLSHSKNYYIGMEIWGLIQDVYGRDKVFELLENPKEFPKYYNAALEKINREDLSI